MRPSSHRSFYLYFFTKVLQTTLTGSDGGRLPPPVGVPTICEVLSGWPVSGTRRGVWRTDLFGRWAGTTSQWGLLNGPYVPSRRVQCRRRRASTQSVVKKRGSTQHHWRKIYLYTLPTNPNLFFSRRSTVPSRTHIVPRVCSGYHPVNSGVLSGRGRRPTSKKRRRAPKG